MFDLDLNKMQKFHRSYRDLITGIDIKTCGVIFPSFCKVLYDDLSFCLTFMQSSTYEIQPKPVVTLWLEIGLD